MSDLPQNYTSEEEITERFAALDDALDNPASVVLIGGGAMTFRGIKDGTKDLDLVATSQKYYKRVREALLELGLEEVDHPEKSYASLGAISVLEFGEDNRVDLFDRQVMAKLILSESMNERSDTVFAGESLSVAMLAPVDIALFKSMTPRENDLNDVERLLASGVDLETYETELRDQLPLNYGFEEIEWIVGKKQHPVFQLEETLGELEAMPETLVNYVGKIAASVEAEAVVVENLRMRKQTDRDQLVGELDSESYVSAEQVDMAIDRLVQKELLVTEKDGSVRLVLESQPDDD